MPSDCSLILATQEGICRFPIQAGGSLGPLNRTLHGVALEAVTQGPSGTLFAGADKGQIYRSQDDGQKWQEVFGGFPNTRGLWSLVAPPHRTGEVYAGLEPVSLWVSRDEGEQWNELTSLRRHPASKNWHFYDPTRPHIRAITFDPLGKRLYVGIEVGGVLSSSDGGASFEDKSQGVDHDVHTLQVSPDDADHIFAMTGGGLFRSQDGGASWKESKDGLDRWYIVPLAFASADSSTLCVGAANNPPPWKKRGADAAIYWSEDGGDSWSLADGPFPLKGMLSSIVIDPGHSGHLFAGTTEGVILRSTNRGKRWTVAAEKLPRIEEMVITQ